MKRKSKHQKSNQSKSHLLQRSRLNHPTNNSNCPKSNNNHPKNNKNHPKNNSYLQLYSNAQNVITKTRQTKMWLITLKQFMLNHLNAESVISLIRAKIMFWNIFKTLTGAKYLFVFLPSFSQNERKIYWFCSFFFWGKCVYFSIFEW